MKSLEELKSIRERMHEELKIRYEREEYYQAGSAEGLENGSQYRKHVLVCGGTGCTSSGSQKIREKLEAELKRNGLENEICVIKTGCLVCAHWDRL